MSWLSKRIRRIIKPVERLGRNIYKETGLQRLGKNVVRETGKALKGVTGAVIPQPQQPAPAPEPPPPPTPAPQPAPTIEPPKKEESDTSDDSQTESGRKKARASGKKGLSVARKTKGGLNI